MILTDTIELFFTICLCLNAILFLPQAYKIYQGDSVKGVSLLTFSCLFFVQFIFMLHSLLFDNILASLSMAAGSILCLSIIIMTIKRNNVYSSVTDLPVNDVVDQMPCSVYWRDKDGNYYGLNKKCLQLFGLSKEEAIGSNLYDMVSKEQADRIMIYDNEVIHKKETVVKREYGPIRKDGCQTVYLSAKAPLIDDNGNCMGLVGVSFDYTDIDNEIKQRVKMQDSILASLPGHVYWLDQHGRFIGCNNNFANSLGVIDKKGIQGKITAIMPDAVDPDKIEATNKKVLHERIKLTVEEKSLRDDGNFATMLSHKVPLFDNKNIVQGMLSSALDISSLKEESQVLERDLNDSKIANKVKYNFITNMSYDIRTPMSGIISMTNALVEQTETNDPKIKESGYKIIQAGVKLLQILDEIIEIADPGTGRISSELRKINIKNIMTNIIDVSIPAAHQKNLKIGLDFDNNIPEFVLSDPIRVHRILYNLVCNAIKFTSKGSINLFASLSQHENNRFVIKFVVKDTGIGIAKSVQDHIFDCQKYRDSDARNGYGLQIVKEFVNDLNGEIYVNSVEGQGAEFVCYIPCKESFSTEDSNFNPVPDIAESGKTFEYKHKDILRSLRANILVVDDDQLAQTATKLLLNNFGCNVTVANDGEEALYQIKKGRFDMVFMDIGLPDISGFNVIDNIRSRLDNVNKDLPIVVLTAHTDKSVLQDIPPEITDIHTKPVSMELCEQILTKYLLKKLEGEKIVDLETI